MPFHILNEGPGVYKKFFGFVTKAEFLQSIFENQSQMDYDQMRYTINDFLDVQEHSLGPSDVELVSMVTLKAMASNPQILIAVVSRDPGISVLVSLFADKSPYRLECFATVVDARNWISTAS